MTTFSTGCTSCTDNYRLHVTKWAVVALMVVKVWVMTALQIFGSVAWPYVRPTWHVIVGAVYNKVTCSANICCSLTAEGSCRVMISFDQVSWPNIRDIMHIVCYNIETINYPVCTTFHFHCNLHCVVTCFSHYTQPPKGNSCRIRKRIHKGTLPHILNKMQFGIPEFFHGAFYNGQMLKICWYAWYPLS